MTLPKLTIAIVTYMRPWYALQTLSYLINHIQYDGERRFVISDGGSPEWQLEMYRYLVKDTEYEIVVEPTSDVAMMLNNVADHSGEVWITALDDFVPMWVMNVTHDVEFLLQNEDVGCLRYANLNNWDVPQHTVIASLRNVYRNHYWVLDKERSTAPVMWTMGFSMTHRRMWDAYAPLPPASAHQPGYCENIMNYQFHNKPGATVALPMRMGQESDMKIPMYQPIAHIGHVRTDEYTERWNNRWGAT